MLNGEFAFVLWDCRRNRLLAARDRAGIRPLYFNWSNERLLLCSEIKGILRAPDIHSQISPEYIYSAALGAVHETACPFENIDVLRPGHMLILEQGSDPVQQRYCHWSFDVDEQISFLDASQLVKSALIKGVERRLAADVPVQCYLSGGIDSAIICSILSSLQPSTSAYHVSFSDKAYSETEEATKIASYCGANLRVLECTDEDIIDNLASTVWHVEAPLPNSNSVAKFMLSRMVQSDGTKVCLTGEGADEMLGGYPFFKLEALWRKTLSKQLPAQDFATALRSLKASDSRSRGSVWNPMPGWKGVKHPYGSPNYFHLSCRENGAVVPLLSGFQHGRKHLEKKFLQLFPEQQYRSMHGFNVTREMAMHRLAGGILPLLGDRVELAHGVECRLPFLDLEFLELLSKLPERYFLDTGRGIEKMVLRAAFADMLPPQAVKARKHPFLAPRWRVIFASTKGRQMLNDTLSVKAIRKAGIFSPAAVSSLKAIWQSLPENFSLVHKIDPLIGILITTQLLYENLASSPYFAATERLSLINMGEPNTL